MLDKSLLFLILPLMLVAALALRKGIPRLVAALQVEEAASLPLAAGGTVDIQAAGELVLSLRGTLGSTDFAGASFALRDAAGQAVLSSMIVVGSLRSGLDGETTVSVRRFQVPAPGRYRIEATGFDPARIAGNSRLVLAGPGGARLILGLLRRHQIHPRLGPGVAGDGFDREGHAAGGRPALAGARAMEPARQATPAATGIQAATWVLRARWRISSGLLP